MSLELAERSLPETIMAAMEERITSDAAIAGLQACLLLDGSLRLRYAKVCTALQHTHSLSHLAMWPIPNGRQPCNAEALAA